MPSDSPFRRHSATHATASRVVRLAARSRQRGAVVFIVAMTLALLGLMGVYAISASATEVRSAGYVRQATQAHYLSEYAMGAIANHVTAANANHYVNTLLLAPPGGPPTNCLSVPTYVSASNVARACVRFEQPILEGTWGGRPLLTEFSLGQAGVTTMQGTVFAELTNPTLTQPPPGFDQAGLSFARVTVTTGGSVQAGGMDPTRPENRTLEMGRARMIVGPVQQK